MIDVPVSGLSAVTDGGAIDLHDAKGRIQPPTRGCTSRTPPARPAGDHERRVKERDGLSITVHDADATYPLTVDPTWAQVAKLDASDGVYSDAFGDSVAVSGTTAIVGADAREENNHNYQGAAYVFTSNGGAWTQVAELTASDGAVDDFFGWSVAISGSTAIVGAVGHMVRANQNKGTAYVFTSNGGVWTQRAELTASDSAPDDEFGSSIAMSGSTAVIGALGHGNSHQGAAYVFTSNGSSWTEKAELAASDGTADAQFGYSVAVSGTNIAVGRSIRQ